MHKCAVPKLSPYSKLIGYINQIDIGTGDNNTWQPREYKARLKVVKEVEQFKLSLAGKTMSEKVRWSKITKFIARKKSRQEFTPLVRKLINRARIEPLHLRNDAWQLFSKDLLKESIAKSNLPASCKKFTDVPKDSCFRREVNALRLEVKSKCLARRVTEWFEETEAKGSDLQYRFTGKDSRLFCHNFMWLIKFLSCEGDSRKQRLTVLVYAFSGLKLRDCVSLLNRFEITNEQIQELPRKSREYFRANTSFLPTSVNPTVWTLGNIVSAYCKEVFQRDDQGLCTVTMEGREAKHTFLKKLSENSSFQRQWYDIFKHEFIMPIWLPEKGFDIFLYKPSKDVYIPSRVFANDNYCYCS